MFGINLDDTYERAWYRANNPPTVNIVVPPDIKDDGIEYGLNDTEFKGTTGTYLESVSEYSVLNWELSYPKSRFLEVINNDYFSLSSILISIPCYSIKNENSIINIKGKSSFYLPYEIDIKIDTNNITDGNIIPRDKINIIKSSDKTPLNISLSILFKNKNLFIKIEESLKLVTLNKLISKNEVFRRVSKKQNSNNDIIYFYDARTQEHINLIIESQKIKPNGYVKWTDYKALYWKSKELPGGQTSDEFIHEFKLAWLTSYKDIIKKASQTYNLPELALAGVLYVEVGGQPPIFDDVTFLIRYKFDEKTVNTIASILTERLNGPPEKTSFGDVSMQIRVAAEMLKYDYRNLTFPEIVAIKESLKDICFGIFICALHLEYLKNIDYSNLSKEELTDEEIQVITTRYNRGPIPTLEEIKQNNSYGSRILKNKQVILTAIK